MKCIRFGLPGAEKPGILDAQGLRRDVSAFGEDYDERFFATNGLQRLSEWLNSHLALCPVVSPETRLGPPFCRPSKIVCVGLNYALHAKESGMAIPSEPVLFFKATTALCGPCDDLVIPPGSEKTDWEVELAVVIGKEASYVPLESAMEHVAGYTIHNDYSERAYQLERSGQWVKGKSCDTFAPMGPALVSSDEIADPQHLRLWLKLNGETMQDSNTSDMVYGVPFLVHYISQFMRLLPGDIISTGTPFGVGMGLSPQRYLRPGDFVELGIEGLGECRQKAVAK
ncbi:MAG: fumarylacetoacetate hydrolase family protein [Haliscomenobacter sp.]